MDTTTQRPLRVGAADRTPRAGAPRHTPRAGDARQLATRVKGLSLGVTLAALAITWSLVSQHVVGATNAARPAVAAPASSTSGRAAVPSADFFGQPSSHPQPILGSGGSAPGGGPIVASGTS